MATPNKPHSYSKNPRRGQSMVEFSLIMPILFLVMTGIVSFGLTMHDYLVLTNGANSGAQVLSMSRGQTLDPCATAVTAVENAAPSLTTAHLTFSFVINGTSYSGTTCTAGAANMLQGDTAKVTVSYPCVLAVYGMSAPACGLATTTTEMIQ